MTKYPTTVRLAPDTQQQLKQLVLHTGQTQTEIICKALDHLHRETFASDAYFLCPHCHEFVPCIEWHSHYEHEKDLREWREARKAAEEGAA